MKTFYEKHLHNLKMFGGYFAEETTLTTRERSQSIDDVTFPFIANNSRHVPLVTSRVFSQRRNLQYLFEILTYRMLIRILRLLS